MSGSREQPWLTRLIALAPYIVICLVLLILPPFLPPYYLSMVTKILIFAIFAMSLDIVMGYAGLLSLGHAAFLGTAGYCVGILMVRYGIDSFWVLMPMGIFIAGIVAAIIGYLALRVSGVFFMLVTLAFGQLLSVAALQWRSMTGGTDGLIGIRYPDLGIAGFSLTASSFYYLVLLAIVICFFILYRITNSPFGRALVGIRENEVRMRCLGYNSWAHRYVAFIIGGIFAGVAGVLFAFFYKAMVPEHLGIITSSSAMLMVIIGGAGTLFGPFIGSAVIVLLEQFASIYSPERWPLILGCAFVLSVLFVRGGFGFYLSRFYRRIRRRYGSIEN